MALAAAARLAAATWHEFGPTWPRFGQIFANYHTKFGPLTSTIRRILECLRVFMWGPV